MTGEMWMTTGVWVTIVGAIFAAMRFLNGLVTKGHCHIAMREISESITTIQEKVDSTNTKVDRLAGYIEAKYDGVPHEHHRKTD